MSPLGQAKSRSHRAPRRSAIRTSSDSNANTSTCGRPQRFSVFEVLLRVQAPSLQPFPRIVLLLLELVGIGYRRPPPDGEAAPRPDVLRDGEAGPLGRLARSRRTTCSSGVTWIVTDRRSIARLTGWCRGGLAGRSRAASSPHIWRPHLVRKWSWRLMPSSLAALASLSSSALLGMVIATRHRFAYHICRPPGNHVSSLYIGIQKSFATCLCKGKPHVWEGGYNRTHAFVTASPIVVGKCEWGPSNIGTPWPGSSRGPKAQGSALTN
jgi:hypothetical protein